MVVRSSLVVVVIFEILPLPHSALPSKKSVKSLPFPRIFNEASLPLLSLPVKVTSILSPA